VYETDEARGRVTIKIIPRLDYKNMKQAVCYFSLVFIFKKKNSLKRKEKEKLDHLPDFSVQMKQSFAFLSIILFCI
jgi:hypothetical protein